MRGKRAKKLRRLATLVAIRDNRLRVAASGSTVKSSIGSPSHYLRRYKRELKSYTIADLNRMIQVVSAAQARSMAQA